jgi:hypothetical protein
MTKPKKIFQNHAVMFATNDGFYIEQLDETTLTFNIKDHSMQFNEKQLDLLLQCLNDWANQKNK